jgi:hypothetical protein
MNNTKEERFHKIASARTNKVINDLRLLSNCANKNNYAYSAQEVEQMFKAVDEAVKNMKSSYNSKRSPKDSFSFK